MQRTAQEQPKTKTMITTPRDDEQITIRNMHVQTCRVYCAQHRIRRFILKHQ